MRTELLCLYHRNIPVARVSPRRAPVARGAMHQLRPDENITVRNTLNRTLTMLPRTHGNQYLRLNNTPGCITKYILHGFSTVFVSSGATLFCPNPTKSTSARRQMVVITGNNQGVQTLHSTLVFQKHIQRIL